jgi:hypothetical protein
MNIDDIKEESVMKHAKEKTLAIRVDGDLLDKFREACKKNGSNMSRTMTVFMQAYVDDEDEQ